MNLRFLLFPLLLLSSASCSSITRNEHAATRQRPLVSRNTHTTAFGTFEVEAGASWDHDDRFETPVVVKYGASPNTEVSVQASPLLIVQDAMDHDEGGVGDVRLGIRHRLWEESEGVPAMGVLAEVKLPAADEDDGLGTGYVDAGFGGMASHKIKDGEVTGFYRIDFLGTAVDDTSVAHTFALAADVPFAGTPLGVFSEVSGTLFAEQDIEVGQFLLGGSYTPFPSVVLDLAGSVGLTSDSPDLVVFGGLTTNFGLWHPPSRTRALPQPN